MDSTNGCTIAVEDVFGPQVATSCLDGFDFTLLFEETILTLLPLGLFLLRLLPKIFTLRQEPVKVARSWLSWAKVTCFSIYIALQCALLGLWAQPGIPKTRATLATSAVTLVGFIVLLYVSDLEHRRSLRPSSLLNGYFLLTIILDIARVRTVWFVQSLNTISPVFLAAYLIKALITLLEAWEKRRLIKPHLSGTSKEAASGILNRVAFFWINSLFFKGVRQNLTVGMLPTIAEDLTDCSKPDELSAKWTRADKTSKSALLWILVKHHKWDIFAGVLPKLAWIGFTFAQPFLVQRVLNFNEDPGVDNTNNIAYGLIAAYAIVYIGLAISYAFYEHKTDRLIVKVRGSLVAMIYNKLLRLKESSTGDRSALTHFSQDVDRVAFGLRQMHETWSALIEIALSLWLLERLLGQALIASALFIVIILIVATPLASLTGNAQGRWLEAIEERMTVTSKALASLKFVRMTGAIDSVTAIISRLRQQEIKASGLFRLYMSLVLPLSYLSDAFSSVIGFGTYIILAEKRGTETLTEGIAFGALTLYSLLGTPTSTLTEALEEFSITINSINRIQEHLVEEEQMDYRQKTAQVSSEKQNSSSSSTASDVEKNESTVEKCEEPGHVAQLQHASARWSEDAEPVLRNLSFNIKREELTMVVGPVGAGKSTLLKLLLGEVSEPEGLVSVNFQHAAYCSQSPWLFFGTIRHNILGTSVWNAPRYQEVLSACALDIDFRELADGDQSRVGAKGSQLSGGQQKRVSLARALYSDNSILILDDPLTGLDRKTEQIVLEKVFSPLGLLKRDNRTAIMATNSAHHLPFAEKVIVINKAGSIEHQGTFEELAKVDDYVQRLGSQAQVASASSAAKESVESMLQEAGIPPEEDLIDEARRNGDLKVYLHYFGTVGWLTMCVYLVVAAGYVFGTTFPTVWVQWWVLSNDEYGTNRVGYWLGTYAGLGALATVANFASSFILLMVIAPTAAQRYHRYLLETTAHATTAVLTGVDTGSLLNRFSQDLELIDFDLPSVLETTIISVLSAIGEGILVFFGSGYFAATIPGVLVVLYLIQKFYLKTSRQLRLLDIESKAPLFSHFIETMDGLVSVRAYGWTAEYEVKNCDLLSRSQKPYYLLFTVQQWLTLVLNLIVAALAIILVAIVATVRNSSTALIGTALFNIVSFASSLEQVITYWTELEQSIGAVSRIKTFVATTEQEEEYADCRSVPESWPAEGRVEFKDLSASYASSPTPVLKSLSFQINPGCRVAICGRTGSGKSSLVSVILRQVEISSGQVLIDGVDISTIARQDVRRSINSMPQDAFFLHGTVRLNMAPLDLGFADETLVESLQAVGLWRIFDDSGGLDAELDESLLSHGQRQLFCLARAICRPGRVVIMDEPTSSVDPDTEAIMQKLIRERLQGRTIIAIVHKLQSMLDFDKVMMLDKGRVVEFDDPNVLLRTPGSAFKALFDAFSNGNAPNRDATPES